MPVKGLDATLWKAELVEDTFFRSCDFDYVGNGVADEVNVGCETRLGSLGFGWPRQAHRLAKAPHA
ncbi:MAG: hypothetical protein CO108_21445 [Deltaproteobacteria bacterium CG_4_9_14_3_um_filter_63_12]|nr:MAG: hypothetical protein CO108_21445 [Deltaproteobacteria bacterium CG_4_9_14_3_um_filter_63_12]